jgi:hypothetical protein
MFDGRDSGVGLWPGEGPEDWAAEDQLAYELTCLDLADGWVDSDRHVLPDGLEEMVPDPFLAVVVSAVDVSRLNGHDLVCLLRAQGRLASRFEAGKYQVMAEIAHAPPSDPDSGVLRFCEEVEYAAVEMRLPCG